MIGLFCLFCLARSSFWLRCKNFQVTSNLKSGQTRLKIKNKSTGPSLNSTQASVVMLEWLILQISYWRSTRIESQDYRQVKKLKLKNKDTWEKLAAINKIKKKCHQYNLPSSFQTGSFNLFEISNLNHWDLLHQELCRRLMIYFSSMFL